MTEIKTKIEISDLPKEVPDYKNSAESKEALTEKWLTNWIKDAIKNKKIKTYSLLPIKSKLAYYLGVSIGTVQNAIRYMEDKGIVESKQRIGTYIISGEKKVSVPHKLTGKRDLTIKQLLYFIVDNELNIGDKIPSIRSMAKMLSLSTNTVRLSIEHLVSKGILKTNIKDKEIFYTVEKIPEIKGNLKLETRTLASKIEEEILKFIKENFKAGDKFLTHHELAKKFNVSVKTTHDAIKTLINKGYLVSRRGQYGTIVVKTSQKESLMPKPEMTIFAPAAQAAIYRYEKIKNYIKQIITQEFDLGEKLPSMQDLAKRTEVSTNTIKKALHDLAKEGYIGFSRGRYGGSFVINIPENQESAAFRWLAVSKKYVTK
ncbi:GntR family transcriptional regulator [bacterium]|nr:GntR family transcriptional regulator [bacterium]